jgi:hypothetical protein
MCLYAEHGQAINRTPSFSCNVFMMTKRIYLFFLLSEGTSTNNNFKTVGGFSCSCRDSKNLYWCFLRHIHKLKMYTPKINIMIYHLKYIYMDNTFHCE